MLKKITWTKKKFNWFFSYIVLSSIVNVGVILFFIWKNYEFRVIDNFDGTVATILSVLGIFIAFSAINTYSVLNARAEENKQELEKSRKEHNEYIVNMEERIKTHHKELDERIKIHHKELDDFKRKMDNYNTMNDIFNIKHCEGVVDKVRAITNLSDSIEIIKKSIDETDSMKEKERLEENLLSLKNRIKQNLRPYYKEIEKIKNKTFQEIFNDFKILLDEELIETKPNVEHDNCSSCSLSSSCKPHL